MDKSQERFKNLGINEGVICWLKQSKSKKLSSVTVNKKTEKLGNMLLEKMTWVNDSTKL